MNMGTMQELTVGGKPKKKTGPKSKVELAMTIDLYNPFHLAAVRWWAEFRVKNSKAMYAHQRNADPDPSSRNVAEMGARKHVLEVFKNRAGKTKFLDELLKTRDVWMCGSVFGDKKNHHICDRAHGHVMPHANGDEERAERFEIADPEYHAGCNHFPRLVLRLLDTIGAPDLKNVTVAVLREFSTDDA